MGWPTSSRTRRAAALKFRAALPSRTRGWRDLGVRPDQGEVGGMLVELRQRPLHLLVVRVTLEVHEEDVGPGAPAAGTTLDAPEIYPLFRKGREGIPKATGAILEREDRAGLVLTRGPRPRAPEHDEARRVGTDVLDVAGEDRETVGLGGQGAADRRHPRLLRRPSRRLRGGLHLLGPRVRQLVAQPGSRLDQSHRVGADHLYLS